MQQKEVINLANGKRLGFICDLEFDICTGCILAFFVPCREKFRWFAKEELIRFTFDQIEMIGKDIVFVRYCIPEKNC